MSDNEIVVKTVEELNREYNDFFDNMVSFLDSHTRGSIREKIKIDSMTKEDIDFLLDCFLDHMMIERLEGWHSDERKIEIKNNKAKLLVVSEKLAKFFNAVKKNLEEQLLDQGPSTPMIGTNQFRVKVYSEGIKKEISSMDLEQSIRKQEQLSIENGLKKSKKAKSDD